MIRFRDRDLTVAFNRKDQIQDRTYAIVRSRPQDPQLGILGAVSRLYDACTRFHGLISVSEKRAAGPEEFAFLEEVPNTPAKSFWEGVVRVEVAGKVKMAKVYDERNGGQAAFKRDVEHLRRAWSVRSSSEPLRVDFYSRTCRRSQHLVHVEDYCAISNPRIITFNASKCHERRRYPALNSLDSMHHVRRGLRVILPRHLECNTSRRIGDGAYILNAIS